MLKIKLYPQPEDRYMKNGNTVFRYKVTGAENEIAAYRSWCKDKGFPVPDAENEGLHLTIYPVGTEGSLHYNEKSDKYFSKKSEDIVVMEDMLKAYGGNPAMEKAISDRIVDTMLAQRRRNAAPTPKEEEIGGQAPDLNL